MAARAVDWSTKIHALGNPVGFFLTGGEAHDLAGADHLLPGMQADTLIGDKAFDAGERVIVPLTAAGKTVVIPSKANRRHPRGYDRDLYKARKQFRAIATRYDKTRRNFLAANPARRHRYLAEGDDPPPAGREALNEPFSAFPSWFLRVECDRCGKVQMVNESHARWRDQTLRTILARMRHDGCSGLAGKAELMTGIDDASRPVRKIVLQAE